MKLLCLIVMAFSLGACANDPPNYTGYNAVGSDGTPVARGYRYCEIEAQRELRGYESKPNYYRSRDERDYFYETYFDTCMSRSGYGRVIRQR
jgi:hypothetical protein